MIVVTSGTQEASLTCAFIKHRIIFESLLLGERATRRIHSLSEEVQVVALDGYRELFIFAGTLIGRPEVKIGGSHIN